MPTEPPRQPRPRQPVEPNPWSLAGVGVELGLVVAALTLGGWWLDQKLGSTPWLMLTGAAIGIIGGLYNVWKLGKRFF